MNQKGPCLEWCFYYYKNNYLFSGFLIGAIFGLVIYIYQINNNKE